jgi:hypothetical protein
MCSINSARAENLIEGICQQFALVWLKRELPESPGVKKLRTASSAVKPNDKNPEEESRTQRPVSGS